jgi:hypothetical protein
VNLPGLPPPPPRFDGRTTGHRRSGWRSAKPGWIVLHLAIGIALGLCLVIFVVGLLGIGHDVRPIQDVDPDDTQLVIASNITTISCFAAGLIGWMGFVYLRASALARALVLGCLSVAAVAISVAALAPRLPVS